MAKAPAKKTATRKPAKKVASKKSVDGEDKQVKPVLDMSDATVKKMIRAAKKRGFITYDELNEMLPNEGVTSEDIEDTMSKLNDIGINVVETEEEAEDTAKTVEKSNRGLPMKVARKTEPVDRTDDPVRMYLREMGSVELLSREGEIAIAKRIEAGREAMIHGLCESPLTFQAIIIWRDELEEGRILLRDIIDLDATFAGPDAKKVDATRKTEESQEEKTPSAEDKTATGEETASDESDDDDDDEDDEVV